LSIRSPSYKKNVKTLWQFSLSSVQLSLRPNLLLPKQRSVLPQTKSLKLHAGPQFQPNTALSSNRVAERRWETVTKLLARVNEPGQQFLLPKLGNNS
jgi:hypothetical protein